jgi:hypothetical protein
MVERILVAFVCVVIFGLVIAEARLFRKDLQLDPGLVPELVPGLVLELVPSQGFAVAELTRDFRFLERKLLFREEAAPWRLKMILKSDSTYRKDKCELTFCVVS